MTATQTLDQRRAKHVVEFLTKNKDKVSKDFAGLAKSFPASVINNGLGPAVAFLKQKGKTQHELLEEALREWLLEKADHMPWGTKRPGLIESIAANDSSVYRAVTNEALAYLSWLRRLATAQVGGEDQVEEGNE